MAGNDIRTYNGGFSADVPARGVVLVKVEP